MHLSHDDLLKVQRERPPIDSPRSGEKVDAYIRHLEAEKLRLRQQLDQRLRAQFARS